MDADLRKSVLVGRYKTGAVKHGLTHALIGRESLEKVVCMTNVQNLYIIFSGPVPPNPSELLGGMKFQGTIQKLREKFDYVIVDTPPLGSVIDAAVAAKTAMARSLSLRTMPSATVLPSGSRTSWIKRRAGYWVWC